MSEDKTDAAKEVEDEKQEEAAPLPLQDIGQAAQDGLAALQLVFSHLPESQYKANAIMFIDTGGMWLQQAFNHEHNKQQKQERLFRLREELKAKGEAAKGEPSPEQPKV